MRNESFYKTSLIALLSLSNIFVFSQTKVGIYNSNANQLENKVFAGNLIASFSSKDFQFEASDKTPNINYLLKNQGQNVDDGNVPDEAILLVVDKLGSDYVVSFTLYPNKTQDNVSASLLNAKTFSVEKTLTLTCNNLKNGADAKAAADKIAEDFLFGSIIAEQKAKEEKALSDKKAKEEMALAEKQNKEGKALTEQKAREEKVLAEQKAKADKAAADSVAKSELQRAKEEKLLADSIEKARKAANLTFENGKIFNADSEKIKKKEVRSIMAGTDALRIYNKGVSRNKKGNALITFGTLVIAGGAAVKIMDETNTTYYTYYDENGDKKQQADHYMFGDYGNIIAWSAIGAGAAMLLPGITVKILGKYNIRKSVDVYNSREKTACAELKCNFTGNGVRFTLDF